MIRASGRSNAQNLQKTLQVRRLFYLASTWTFFHIITSLHRTLDWEELQIANGHWIWRISSAAWQLWSNLVWVAKTLENTSLGSKVTVRVARREIFFTKAIFRLVYSFCQPVPLSKKCRQVALDDGQETQGPEQHFLGSCFNLEKTSYHES